MKQTSCSRWFFQVLIALMIASPLIAPAQQPLPIDSKITRKRLPNGLTYYIRENKKPENRAMFRLVVNAGSVLEQENEQGLAHFLEHMAFNGTEHFQKQELVNFLERVGMQFGADLNAYTSFDETVYMLEVPMDDAKVLENTFQILEDWAHAISFDAAEIDKERGVVTEEWRTGRDAQGRLQDKQIPAIFHDSLYAERLPIGKTNIIATAPRQVFVDFYKRWYRPDLMAVVAVGDFETANIEKLILKHFSGLENPPNAPVRPKPAVPDHTGTLFSIETDPELSFSMVQIVCKHPPAPEDTAEDYRRNLVEQLYSGMLNRRLGERVQEANPPYLYAGIGKSRMVREKDIASQVAVVKEGEFALGLKTLLLEAKRARRDGFTGTELERAKADLLRGLEKAYEERDKSNSTGYADEYVRNFLEGEPIPGIEKELEMTRAFLGEVQLDEVNHTADRWITETNRVILFSAPQKTGLAVPTQEQILEVIAEADRTEIAAYEDDVPTTPLLPATPKAGTIVSETRNEALGTIEWKLSNGARVLLKATDFKNDQILLRAFSPGGDSLVSDSDYMSAQMAPAIVGQSGLGDYDLIQLRKKLSGKVASVTASIDDQFEGIGGSASPKDIETWFQLLHLTFTSPRSDEKTFQSILARLEDSVRNRERDPQAVFGDAIEKALYGNHHRHRPMSLELLKELDREVALRVFRDRFADAGDFTFVLVGAFQPESLRPMVETYVASLPSTGRREKGRSTGDDPKSGHVNVEVKKGLEPRSSVRMTFHGKAPWNNDERYALRSAVDVLKIRLREVLREDKGGVYGVGVYGDLSQWPKETYSCGISFTCSPDNVESLTQAALEEIKRLQADGPNQDNFEKITTTHRRSFEEGLKENGFWLANLTFYRQHDLDPGTILTFPDRVTALTPERIQEAARKYFSGENLVTAKLFPESEPPSIKP
jgi:zinc protease